MVDNPNGFDPDAPPVPMTIDEEAPKGFLGSTTGKWVVGGIALVLVLIAIGVAAYVFLFSTPATVVVTSVTPPKPAGVVTTGSVSPTATAPIVVPGERPLTSTFTFRNIFAPTMAEPVAAIPETSTAAASSGTTATPNVPADTLYLASIQTVDGKQTATFIWNKQTYTLGEGDPIPNSPWQVLQINTSSVVMLFGDTQVTLSLGQGLTK
jgi:hypothetical protein